MNKETIQKKSFENRIERLPDILDFLMDVMQEHGVGEEKMFDIQTAVDEACTNIIQYSFPDKKEETIEISCNKEENSFIVTVKHSGEPFDPRQVKDPDLDEQIETREVGGLGIYFMRQLLDEFRYEYKDGLEILVMVKYI